MKSVKEILIQDIGTKSEIERFIRCNIYRRDETFSNPLYFAPYFSAKGLKNSTLVREQGITHISEVLGVITMDISNIDKGYLQDKFKEFIKLKYFSNEDEKKLLNKWIKGIKIDIKKGKKQTFYFLDNPIKLKRALLKDSATGKGRGKDWISAMIPKNRTIPFSKFIEKINEFY